MNTIIRPANAHEADELTALCMLSKQSNGYDDEFMASCAEELKVTRAHIVENNFWVTERDAICGCACLKIEPNAKTGEIEAFFIHPDFQNLGIGTLLWKQLLDIAIKNRLTKLHLDADPFAESFYSKLGFTTVGQVPSGSIEGRNIPYMEMSLIKALD